MNDDQSSQQIAKLFAYIEKRFDSLEQEMKIDIESLREEVRTGFDQVAAKLDDGEVERAAITSQLDRHERWHEETAKSINLTLKHEA
ncbi:MULTISPECIES: hypothetical protein [Nocardia]|uniref:hypothetical protein n=1 Tax=Nocardia TaxID=1817 RepID=UPI0024590AFD|nr:MULTISPECIES: hypothetical protein [Nocardia]